MGNRDKWRLCGGTFFILISDARKPMPSHSEMYEGKKSEITEPETLLALARIITPSIPNPMSSENGSYRDGTLDFKACVGWGWKQFLFRDTSAKKSFDDRIKNEYPDCLACMTAFTNKYLALHLDSRKDEFLVKAILELLDADKTLPDDTAFYAHEDGSTATKKELLAAPTICLEPFLLGIWHYCIVVIKKNTIGRDTYAEWCPPTEGNNNRPYTAGIGENSKRKVEITYCNPNQFNADATDNTAGEGNNSFTPEPEIVDSIPAGDENPQPQNVTQSVNNPIVFNINMSQTGNGRQFGYIQDYHEKEEN